MEKDDVQILLRPLSIKSFFKFIKIFLNENLHNAGQVKEEKTLTVTFSIWSLYLKFYFCTSNEKKKIKLIFYKKFIYFYHCKLSKSY